MVDAGILGAEEEEAVSVSSGRGNPPQRLNSISAGGSGGDGVIMSCGGGG